MKKTLDASLRTISFVFGLKQLTTGRKHMTDKKKKVARKKAPAKKFVRKPRPAKGKGAATKKKGKAPQKKSVAKATGKKKISVRKKAAVTPRRQSGVLQGAKAKLVRDLPRSLPASEVVEKCATKGMKISKAYVHNIRSAANKAARAFMKKEGKVKLTGGVKKLEGQFKELVVTLGPARAKRLLTQVETSLSIAAQK